MRYSPDNSPVGGTKLGKSRYVTYQEDYQHLEKEDEMRKKRAMVETMYFIADSKLSSSSGVISC